MKIILVSTPLHISNCWGVLLVVYVLVVQHHSAASSLCSLSDRVHPKNRWGVSILCCFPFFSLIRFLLGMNVLNNSSIPLQRSFIFILILLSVKYVWGIPAQSRAGGEQLVMGPWQRLGYRHAFDSICGAVSEVFTLRNGKFTMPHNVEFLEP